MVRSRASGRGRAVLAAAALAVLAVAPVAAQHGAHAEHARPDAAARTGYTDADVRFMQHMIVHHAQALVMSRLAPERAERREIRLLAERIHVSQDDEIALMQRWLRERGQPAPQVEPDHHSHYGHGTMPGMLSEPQLARLAAASGAEFDRLFLEFMIHHHEGALVMVAELFASEGAGQDVEIFRFAADVDADQRIEIDRMRSMLVALETPR